MAAKKRARRAGGKRRKGASKKRKGTSALSSLAKHIKALETTVKKNCACKKGKKGKGRLAKQEAQQLNLLKHGVQRAQDTEEKLASLYS